MITLWFQGVIILYKNWDRSGVTDLFCFGAGVGQFFEQVLADVEGGDGFLLFQHVSQDLMVGERIGEYDAKYHG